jgi:hypothetical protein
MMVKADYIDECLAEMEADRESDRLECLFDALSFLHENDERNEVLNAVCDYLECGGLPILCE